MNLNDWAPIATAIVATIAFVDRLFWTKHYSNAKEAEISAIKAQLEAVKELTPVKVKEAFDAMKAVLSEHIDNLKKQIDDMQEKLKVSEQKIEELKLESAQKPTDQRVLRLIDIVKSSNAQIKIDAKEMYKIMDETYNKAARAGRVVWAELEVPDPPRINKSSNDEQLLKRGEWLIFRDPRRTLENGMHDAMKERDDFISEMKRRGIDVDKWLKSLPTDAQYKDAERKRIEEIITAIKNQLE